MDRKINAYMELLDENNGAKFSECEKHRLYLWRIWDESKTKIMFIGLNPSKANKSFDDNTMKRVKQISLNLGYGGCYMTNLFTFISKDPSGLDMALGNHESSDEILKYVASKCSKIVFAWGNFKVMGRDNEIKKMFPDAYALKINQNGSPRHPLYVNADIAPVKYQ
jgi:hypothetical protein